MKGWQKFILYLIVGLSGMMASIAGFILIFEPYALQATTLAGITIIISGLSAFSWVMFHIDKLNKWN